MKKKQQKTMITIIVMFVLVMGVGIGFWQVMEHKRAQNQVEKRSEIEEVNSILKKDFDTAYPTTPREVVKMYSRINSCLYNNSMKDEERMAVAMKLRELFDEELLEANPLKEHIEDLEKEIEEYRKAKKSISSYTVDKNSSVIKQTMKKREYASICASYLVQEKSGSYSKTYEEFLLRQDDKGNWKILGWELIAGKNDETEK